jgi:hypothetical protein
MNIQMILPIEDHVEVDVVLLNDDVDDDDVLLQDVIDVFLPLIVHIFDEAI